ncbi:MAG TPA: GNAT family N-acetyltransferase, partial [Chloroflexota bacterium]|nr:GNAT family N-acetyltransferase [Chloroflexota bacterium]
SPDLVGLAEELTPVSWRPSYVLELPEDPDDLRFGDARGHSRLRRAVNAAARAGVTIRQAETLVDLRAWYGLYLETMRWHCLPPRSFRFFQAVWDNLGSRDLMRLLLAERYEAGKPTMLAGSMFLRFGRTVFYAFNGRRREELSRHPNDLIQWQAIHEATSEKFRRYDLGEVPTGNLGLDRFKRKWGATTTQLYRYYYPAPREPVDGSYKSDGHLRGLVNRCWQALPLAMTVVVGGVVYEYL